MAQMQTVSPDIVAASVRLIRLHGQQPRFINFLRQICGTRERPMPNNQNWIVAETLGSGHDPLDVFCRAGPASLPDSAGQMRETWAITCRRRDDPNQFVVVDTSQFCHDVEDLTKRSIREWDLSGEDSFSPREIFIYYCYSLKFIVSLCYGRNSLARDHILRASERHGLGLEFGALLRAVTDNRLPYGMRSYLMQVLRALYVDIEPYQPLKLPRHVRMMSRAGAMRLSLLSAANSPTINILIATLLAELKEAVAAPAGFDGTHGEKAAAADKGEEATDDALERGERTVGRNMLVLNMLKLVHEMFRLGMMDLDSPVTQEVLLVLLELIQKLDSLPLDMVERFKRSYSSKVVMEAKKEAMKTIDFALDMKSEEQCAAIFEYFASWQRSPERQEYWARRQAADAAGKRRGGSGGAVAGVAAAGEAAVAMIGAAGSKAIGAVQAAAGLLGGPRVRSGASLLSGGGSSNKVAPAPSTATDSAARDPEAPPPASKDSTSGAAGAGAEVAGGEEEGSGSSDYGGLMRWVSSAYDRLAADNEEDDFPLFRLDTLSDTEPLHRQEASPVMKLLDLARYEDQDLTAKTFQLLERLTSKREKLLGELMRTFVVTDDDLIALATWALKQVEVAQHAYNYLGSLDPRESRDACNKAAQAIDALTSLLVPYSRIDIGGGSIEEAAAGGGRGAGGAPERVIVSRTTAANCQYLMYDMQIHLMVLKFLKLPLRRKPSANPREIQQAEDPARLEVFRACLAFLRHFMVVGDLEAGAACVYSHPNQAAVLPHLGLLLSFLDTRGLPTSDTVSALFVGNKANAVAEGEKVIRKLIKLIIRYGDKQHAGWLELLGKVMVVEGAPLKRNQMVALQLLTQYDETVLELLTGPDSGGLEELAALLASERLSARPSPEPPVSRLAYHTACVQLLAECCTGKEPELVVRASGYLSLAQVLDVLLLQPSEEAGVSEANVRYVQRAYWRLLQHCYFATDTDNTKVQVRHGGNRIWPLQEEGEEGAGGERRGGGMGMGEEAAGGEGGGGGGGGAGLLMHRFLDLPAGADRKQLGGGGGRCLVQAVLEEVKRALAEPSDALANADSAAFFLSTCVFPALAEYFDNHWHSHVAKLPAHPAVMLADLSSHLVELYGSLRRLKDVANSQSVKAEIKMAQANIRSLLAAMPPETHPPEAAAILGKTTAAAAAGVAGLLAAPGGKSSAPSTSQRTTQSTSSQKVVQREWVLFLRRLAEQVSVELNPASHEIVEVLHSNALVAAAASSLGMGDRTPVFEQAALLRLARLFASPYGRLVPCSSPPMCFEELMAMLCELLASRGRGGSRGRADGGGGGGGSDGSGGEGRLQVGPADWRPELLVKLVRVVRAAVVLDDGAGAADSAALRDAWAAMGLLRVDSERVTEWHPPSAARLEWRQGKYDKLGATRAAATLLAHPMPEVQLEALQLLDVLLKGSNTSVQFTLHDVLKDGSPLADAVFANGKAAFDRCRRYVAQRTYGARLREAPKRKATELAEEAKKAVAGAVNAVLSRGSMVAGVAGLLGKTVINTLATTGVAARDAGARLVAAPSRPQRTLAGAAAAATSAAALLKAGPAPAAAAAAGAAAGGSGASGSASSPHSLSRRFLSNRVGSRLGSSNAGAGAGVDAAVEDSGGAAAEGRGGGRPLGEALEEPLGGASSASGGGGGAGGEEEEDEEEELRWEDKAPRLNAADNAYEFSRVLLAVLKSMVEGHFKHLQALLQLQPASSASIDLVVEAVDLLNVLQDFLPSALLNEDSELAQLMVLVCLFVQEMVQGPCPGNQQSLAGTNFLASCNRIFNGIEYSSRSREGRRVIANKCAVKCALLNLLTSLLEACSSSDIPARCHDILEFASIDRQIFQLCKVLGLSEGCSVMYPPDGEDMEEGEPEELADLSARLEDELLLFCAYVLKLHAVTPAKEPPLPYIFKLFNGEDVDKLLDQLTPDQASYAGELQAFLQRRLGYVEINWKGQLIEPCFFSLTPECSALVTSSVWCEATLDRINNTVSPDSRAFPTVKAAELVDVMEDVVDDIELRSQLMRSKWLKLVSVLANWRMRLLEATFYLAVATLIFQALADARWGPHDEFSSRRDSWATLALSVAVMVQSFVTLLLYIAFAYTDLNKYLSHQVPHTSQHTQHILAAARDFTLALLGRGEQQQKGAAAASAASSAAAPAPAAGGGAAAAVDAGGVAAGGAVSGKDAAGAAAGGGGGSGGGAAGGKARELASLREGAAAARRLELRPPPQESRRGWGDLLLWVFSVLVSLARYTKFWYFNMLVSASLAGFFVSPFFLVFHFTIYFLDFDSGKQLVLAIQRSGTSILNTFVLAVLSIYVFAVVTFLVFSDPTRVDKGDGPPCDTFYKCMGAHMLTGIMGDISTLFNSDLWDTVPDKVGMDGLQQARSLFVLAFFMLWNFVLSNIFVGLIASAFEAIRDDQNTITSDRLSKCLVCSQDMYLFNEKIQGGFDEHILKQHNALSYVYFLHHLRATPRDDYTGAESVVAAVLAGAKTTTDKGTWLPVSKSLAVMHAVALAAQASKEAGGGGAG
ncbi:hypothetical protein Agub_g7473, partial [Astrephomene gubernaculifera]